MRSISVEGGYVWRVSTDLAERAGETPTTATQIWVQPPGTPAIGMAFLRAYEVTGEAAHLAAARDSALALARGQLESGGWDYRVEFDPEKRGDWRYRADATRAQPTRDGKASNRATFDDDNTQSALRFLLAFCEAAKASPDPRDAAIAEARDYGLRRLIDAQYPAGGWPQRWDGEARDAAQFPARPASFPAEYAREQPKGGYYEHYTLNDNTHRDCILTLLDAWKKLGREEHRDAARRGVDFLLLAQLPEPQPAWAQQYDAAMQPAWARAFEPPSVTAGESAGIINLLLDMHQEFGDARYLEAARKAGGWLRRSEIAPGRWARLYELKTNRPLYGDRDGRIHYTLEEISEERRRGYGWEGGFGIERALERIQNMDTRESRDNPASRPRVSDEAVSRILSELDEAGRWVTTQRVSGSARAEWISSRAFIGNMAALCDWLEGMKGVRE